MYPSISKFKIPGHKYYKITLSLSQNNKIPIKQQLTLDLIIKEDNSIKK